MTADIAALDRLIEAVKAGDLTDVNRQLGAMFANDHSLAWDWVSNVNSAFRGSFDAFMALKEALVHDWAIDQMSSWPGGKSFVRLIGTHVEDDGERWHSHKDGRAEGESENLARAGLLALLRAHRAQIGGQ